MNEPLDIADALTWSLARQCRPGDVLINGVGTPLAIAAGLLARELLAPDLCVTRVVTGVAEIEFRAGQARLAALQPGVELEAAVTGCGFELAHEPGVPRAEPLPDEARALLREPIDPHDVRLLELREGRAAALERLEALAR